MRTILVGAIAGVCVVLWAGIVDAQTAYDNSTQIATSTSFVSQDVAGANEPPAPTAKPADQAAEKKDEAKKDEEKTDEENKDEDKPWKLFNCCWLDEHRINVRGWLDQGITLNSASPADRFNGPVGYNDRSNEYMLNQLYLITERTTKVEGDCGTDWGFRVDLLYGEDRRYTAAAGLDSNWNDNQRFYGLSMPQMYVDLAVNKWIFRVGHMLAPCGYESVMAPENFFYSHSYSFLYGQPTTITGGEAMYKIDDQWTANAGLFTGWNDWTDETNRLNYFGGFNWTSKDDECHKDRSGPSCSRPSLATPTRTTPTPRVSTTAWSSRSRSARSGSSPWSTTTATTAASSTTATARSPTARGPTSPRTSSTRSTIAGRPASATSGSTTTAGRWWTTVGPPAMGPYPGNFQACTWGLNWKPNKSEERRSSAANSATTGQTTRWPPANARSTTAKRTSSFSGRPT